MAENSEQGNVNEPEERGAAGDEGRRPEAGAEDAVGAQETPTERQQKLYHRHSGYPGGLKTRTLNDMLERRPEEVIRLAVRGMLPKNRLARKQLTKLKVYAGPEHPHAAQQPQPMALIETR